MGLRHMTPKDFLRMGTVAVSIKSGGGMEGVDVAAVLQAVSQSKNGVIPPRDAVVAVVDRVRHAIVQMYGEPYANDLWERLLKKTEKKR